MNEIKNIIKQQADAETNNIDYIVQTGSRLSMEASETTFLDAVKSKIASFVEKAGDFIASLTTADYKYNPVHLGVAQKVLDDAGYAALRNLAVHVPAGFTGKLPELLKRIDAVLPELEHLEASLQTTLAKLALVLNETDRLKAQSGIRDLEGSLKLIDVKRYTGIKELFKPHQKAMARFSDVFDRAGDVTAAYKSVNEINARLGKINFTQIDRSTNRLADLSKECAKALLNNPEVSGTIGRQLSEVIYKLGVTVTVGSMVCHIMSELTNSMQLNVDTIGKFEG